jgi:hypothetical protein
VRVGYIKLSEEKDSSRTLEQAYQLAPNVKLLEEDEYEGFDGKAQYTIEIRWLGGDLFVTNT